MSAFNVLQTRVTCPSCTNVQQADIQFRYGDTWQHTYVVGDRLRWGGNDVGEDGFRLVLVDGAGPPCACGTYLDCEIRITDGVISGIQTVGARRVFPSEGYLVLRP